MPAHHVVQQVDVLDRALDQRRRARPPARRRGCCGSRARGCRARRSRARARRAAGRRCASRRSRRRRSPARGSLRSRASERYSNGPGSRKMRAEAACENGAREHRLAFRRLHGVVVPRHRGRRAGPLRVRAVRHAARTRRTSSGGMTSTTRPTAPSRWRASRPSSARGRRTSSSLHSDLYNVLEPAVHARLREIAALGHWIGLHFDAGFDADGSLDERAAWEGRVLAEALRRAGGRGVAAQPVGVGNRGSRRRGAGRHGARGRPQRARRLCLRLGLERLLAVRAAARRRRGGRARAAARPHPPRVVAGGGDEPARADPALHRGPQPRFRGHLRRAARPTTSASTWG